jgi:hypothetical protein
MVWSVPKIWKGGDVWILGGGPSVIQQFYMPSDIVSQVLEGKLPVSAYSPYMEPIHKKHVIGVNAAFEIGTWIDMVVFGDSKYFVNHRKKMALFPGLRVGCTPAARTASWAKELDRDGKKPYGLTMNPTKVSWNGNSGSAAINVAVHTGAKRIFLLGFDMKLAGGEKHWHRVYSKGKPIKRVGIQLPFPKHLVGFPAIKEDADKLGVQIFNVCPDSAIKEFPKLTLKEALLL